MHTIISPYDSGTVLLSLSLSLLVTEENRKDEK